MKKEKVIKILKINKEIFLDYFIREVLFYYEFENKYEPLFCLAKDGSIHHLNYLNKEEYLFDLNEFLTEDVKKKIYNLEEIYLKSNKSSRKVLFDIISKTLTIKDKKYKFLFY